MSEPTSASEPSPLRILLRACRYLAILAILGLSVSVVGAVRGEVRPKRASIANVQFGFQPIPDGAASPTLKAGLWAPVFVTLKLIDTADERDGVAKIRVEARDNEDFQVIATRPLLVQPDSELGQTLVFHVKPGHLRADVRVTLLSGDDKQIESAVRSAAPSELGIYLYLSLGSKLDDLADALVVKEQRSAEESKAALPKIRFAVHGQTIGTWQALDGIDLAILNTGDKGLGEGRPENEILELLNWVRRGGRLVLPIHPDRAASIASAIRGHQKARPATPPYLAKNLIAIESWAGLQNKPFPPRGEPPIPIAQLDPTDFGFDSWDVQAQYEDKSLGGKSLPLIARASYGFGSVTFIAFPLDSGAFVRWSGRVEFLRTLIDQVGPRYVTTDATKSPRWETEASVADWGAQLQRDLDNFNVPRFSFGTVAFWMLGYIVLVSVIDQLLLRRLIGRLEATWVTLPLMVAGVSLAAYWAIASPEHDIVRVNEIDLLDFDLRTSTAQPLTAYGGSLLHRGSAFYNVRADRISRISTTIKPERSLDARHQLPATISWFGRADDGPAGIGRAGGQSLSEKSYQSIDADSKLFAVPFAFRATKAFAAEWASSQATPSDKASPPPFVADLAYHSRDSAVKVSGTIAYHLPFDLDEAGLFIFDRVYTLDGGLKKGQTRKIEIRETDNGQIPSDWKNWRDANRPEWALGKYDPGVALRNILFHERLDPTLKVRNHLFRRLDWSWRLRDDPRMVNVPLASLGTQEAILVGRAKLEEGPLEVSNSAVNVILDRDGGVSGRLARDVYVRAIIPMKPK